MMQVIESTVLTRVKRMEARAGADGAPVYEIEFELVNICETGGSNCSQTPINGTLTLKTSEHKLFEMVRPGFMFEFHPQRLQGSPWFIVPNGVTPVSLTSQTAAHPQAHGAEKRY